MASATNRGRPARRRSELERLLDLTVLEPTHPKLGANLRIGPNGVRTCRACNAANQRAFRQRGRQRSAQ